MSHVSFIDSFLRTFLKIILRLVQYKNSTPLWSHPIPRDQELTKFNLHLSEDVSTRFSFFNQMVSKKNIFLNVYKLKLVVIIYLWKRARLFILTNSNPLYLNPLHLRMLWTRIDWSWSCGSWEEVKKLNKLQAGEQRDGHRTKRDQKNSFKALAQVIEKSKAYTIWQKKLNPDWLKSSV